jgi:eukaryotic-like serine/threonine-protein kinase
MDPDRSRQVSSDTSSSFIGRRVGTYEIHAPLGAGAMGEVYRARDTRLGRDVAIKVLPTAFTADADRLARFEREARMLAALNHPHIAAIYGLEESDGLTALILELVEGATLAERIARGPLPLSEATIAGRDIAAALEAAHDKGIIHRDLKPANVKVTPDGAVKVLDFGLAKAMETEWPDAAAMQGETRTADATREGLIIGTPAYMSPEQARGQRVDKRTDIWAFGCMLYEMLTGRAAFAGATITDTLAAIVEREPEWSRLPAATSRSVWHLLQRCLEKDAKRRLRDIGEARVALEDALAGPAADDESTAARGVTRRTAVATLAGAAIGAAATGAFAIGRHRGAVPRDLAQFAIALPDGDMLRASFNKRIAISPNGTQVACNVIRAGADQLLVRSLRDLDLRVVEGVPGGIPFFSPESDWLAYIDTRGLQLKKVALSGGAPATVSTSVSPSPAGATWADDDTIYFVAEVPGGIVRVTATGGEPNAVLTPDLDAGERLYKFPLALPGGRAVLFTLVTVDAESFDDAQIAVWSAGTGQKKVLVEGGSTPHYSPSGHLVYARNGNLLAVRFDPERLAVVGQPVTVLEGVLMSRTTGVANFSLAANGDLFYAPGQADGGARTLALVDRRGNAERLPLPARSYLHPRISPDGHKLAIEIEGSNHDIYVYDFASGVLSNITTDGISHWPIWSPDGQWIGYRSGPMGRYGLWQVRADRSRPPEQIQGIGQSQSVGSYSPDGRAMVYLIMGQGVPPKLAIAPLDGQGAPQPLGESRFAEGSPKVSPDGRWLAYCSNESGRPQVYVQAFPGPGPKVQVSNDGGTDPVWRRTGEELFYRNGDAMVAVPVTPTFSAGRPQELWKGHYSHGMSSSCGAPGVTSSNYDVTPDGQRFLMIEDAHQDLGTARHMVVVQNWADELRRKA